ncbi:iron-containing alcohol dehydrogenase [Metapseudomonas lalkuanensis]|uniref:Iron-containing alcohol dehydrogenase n=1 Tax=Metapseudomonas lalkuanensis TaxID=2604832 RepID=A0A5J6QQF4_9GAMM|nr:iron-containing alcohol dehydrogenase [Pseudomonas lalkuanensis]QEY62976.1 iron-containing alcohol dehydrogenase [Pseudomonas lalkuanensis]
MRTLAFNTTKSILIECGASRRLAAPVRSMGCQSVLIVTDPGVLKAHLLDSAVAELERDRLQVTVFSEVQADPPESVILAAVETAKARSVDCVIGFCSGLHRVRLCRPCQQPVDDHA